MKRLLPGIVAALFMPSLAVAQQAETKFEITPIAGIRANSEFSATESDTDFEVNESDTWGLTINGSVRPDAEWELLYASQSTDVSATGPAAPTGPLNIDVQYLQLGGTYLFDGDRVRPFVAMTIGASRFDPAPGDYSAKTFLSASLGGGWKIRLSRNFGVRLEARAYSSFVDDNNSLFCESDGGAATCLVLLEGEIFTQWEARAGISIRF